MRDGENPMRIALLAILGLGSSEVTVGQAEKPRPVFDFSLPREERINLAESAAPPAISGSATIYVLERSGYEKVREGTNGFTCLVDRQTPLNQEPTCFDAEGSATTLATRLFVEEMRGRGKSEEEINAAIQEGYKTGKYRAPRKPGIVYMMSDAIYLYVAKRNQIVHGPAHDLPRLRRLQPAARELGHDGTSGPEHPGAVRCARARTQLPGVRPSRRGGDETRVHRRGRVQHGQELRGDPSREVVVKGLCQRAGCPNRPESRAVLRADPAAGGASPRVPAHHEPHRRRSRP